VSCLLIAAGDYNRRRHRRNDRITSAKRSESNEGKDGGRNNIDGQQRDKEEDTEQVDNEINTEDEEEPCDEGNMVVVKEAWRKSIRLKSRAVMFQVIKVKKTILFQTIVI